MGISRFAPSALIVIAGFAAPVSSHAARPGIVAQESDVYETPALIGRVVGRVGKGDPVEASNVPVRGFYKIKSPSGVIGYVPMEFLDLKEASAPVAEATVSVANPAKGSFGTDRAQSWRSWFRISAQGGYTFYSNSDLNDVFNTTSVSGGASYAGLDLGVLVTPNFHLVGRAEWISKRVYAAVSGGGTEYQLDTWSYPLMGGLAIALPIVPQLAIEAQALAGVGYSTYFTSAVEGSVTRYGSVAPFALLALGRVDIRPAKHLGFFAEGGYRILKTSATGPREVSGGAEIFKKDGDYRALSVDLSGVEFSGGVSLFL